MKAIELNTRSAKELREESQLAPFAFKSGASRGRRHREVEDELRTCFERDRDRVVHSTAFRRLMYKTQVFVNSEGDHNRTRLSHSLEVCQVARSVGGALKLNEPLCEAIALAHDLGHPPFGHRGEAALDERMAPQGGFRHNAQVLRVVDLLERRSPAYSGLNLSFEVRESLLKHEEDADWPDEFRPKPRSPLLEAQIVDLADSTAYAKHDLEDGLRAGMFPEEDLREEVPLWREARDRVDARHPGFLSSTRDEKLVAQRVGNELIGICIQDLIRGTCSRLVAADVGSVEAVREGAGRLVAHTADVASRVAELNSFLYRRFYRHEHLQRFLGYARAVLGSLFDAYLRRPEELAPWYGRWADEVGLDRAICDYIAGMTDRFAQLECSRLCGEELARFPTRER